MNTLSQDAANALNRESPNFDRYNIGDYLKNLGLPALGTGNTYFVDSGSGSDCAESKYGTSSSDPYATLDYAIGKCTANNGDTIILMPGHAEDVESASAITCDVAGVTILGLGHGADRPTFTFKTLVGASIVVSAASVKIVNVIGLAGKDALTNPFHIQAADCFLDITWRDVTDVEAVRAILTTAAADRLTVKLKYEGYTGGDACENGMRLVGVDGAEIDINAYGLASTAWVEFHTTACSNVNVRGFFYNQGTSDLSLNVVDTVTGSTWSVKGFDGEAGAGFSGGQDTAVAVDDTSAVSAKVDTVDTVVDAIKAVTDNLPDSGALSTIDTVVDAIKAVTDNLPDSGALTTLLGHIYNGTGNALPTNVSLYDAIRLYGLGKMASKQITYDGSASYTAFTVTGLVAVKAIGYITTALSNDAATTSLGTATSAAGLIAATAGTAMQTANQVWTDNAPSKIETFPSDYSVIGDGEDIVVDGDANLAAGVVTFYCFYIPISSDGAVVAA